MLGNNTMETASTEIMPIRRRNNVEKPKWKTHRYFVDFESQIHVQISTSNRCHNFHVDSLFRIDVILTNFPRGISTLNRFRIDEDVSIGFLVKVPAEKMTLLKYFWIYPIVGICFNVTWNTYCFFKRNTSYVKSLTRWNYN